MDANLAAEGVERRASALPPVNWGVGAVAITFFATFGAQIFFQIPIAVVEGGGDFSTAGSIALQLITAASFFVAPFVLAAARGATGNEAASRLGLRRFGSQAIPWMAVAVAVYIAFSALYIGLIGEPSERDIAEDFGPVPFQILLIAIAAPISEETFFRGMIFGGLRSRMARLPAALISGVVFGGLHAFNGIEVVPPLIVFGVILALLYEKTGSIVPGIMLHMLNNSLALIAR